MEADLVRQAGLPYQAIPAAGVHGVAIRELPRNLSRLARGLSNSRRILKQFRPQALLFTGGYIAAPMAFAGRCVPSVVFVPDIEPGLSLKFLARFADRITVTAQESQTYFKQPVFVTGYPLRPDLSGWNRESARSALQISGDDPCLLVFGGSKGARSLNTAVMKTLPALLKLAQVIHITGARDWDQTEQASRQLPDRLSERYHCFAYLHEMGKALAAADLVVSRAGASSLGEFPYFGLPAILVPYPHAWRYQKVNADYLAEHGAAVILEDESLGEQLLVTVTQLLDDDDRRVRMRQAMQSLARPGAAQAVAGHLLELAGAKSL